MVEPRLSTLKKRGTAIGTISKKYQLLLLLLPSLIYIIIFHYLPMFGIIIAFKNYVPHKGILGSDWVGFEHFATFMQSPMFWRLIKNTLSLSVYSLIAGFPLPILLALSLNYIKNARFKKTVQTITYAPHFISVMVLVGMLSVFFDKRMGIFNQFLNLIGRESIFFLGDEQWFPHMYVWSGVWQNIGWNSIIYVAALAGIDPSLHEAAIVDGAGILKRIRYIDIPMILPTIITLFILNMGNLMSMGYEKILLMQNAINAGASEVISTYVYKVGLVNAQYSFSAAIGVFNSVINLILLFTVNRISKKVQNYGIW